MTVTVKVWSVSTGLVACCGSISIFASTHVLVAGPELLPCPSVSTKTSNPSTSTVDDAFIVVVPGSEEVTTTVH